VYLDRLGPFPSITARCYCADINKSPYSLLDICRSSHCLAYLATSKIDATSASVTLVPTYQTIRRHMLGDHNIDNHLSANLRYTLHWWKGNMTYCNTACSWGNYPTWPGQAQCELMWIRSWNFGTARDATEPLTSSSDFTPCRNVGEVAAWSRRTDVTKMQRSRRICCTELWLSLWSLNLSNQNFKSFVFFITGHTVTPLPRNVIASYAACAYRKGNWCTVCWW